MKHGLRFLKIHLCHPQRSQIVNQHQHQLQHQLQLLPQHQHLLLNQLHNLRNQIHNLLLHQLRLLNQIQAHLLVQLQKTHIHSLLQLQLQLRLHLHPHLHLQIHHLHLVEAMVLLQLLRITLKIIYHSLIMKMKTLSKIAFYKSQLHKIKNLKTP